MQRKFRNRNRQKPRLGLRMVIYISASVFFAAFTASVIFIQLLEDTPGTAANNPMVISDIKVTQDTTPVYRGTNKQAMLCINIITTGNTNKLNFNTVTLAARGTSPAAIDLVQNARLWYTGEDGYFTAQHQLGSTIGISSTANFSITSNMTLREGNNYFWLTYDISDKPKYGQFSADAECISLRVGTLEYIPSIAAPPGGRKILLNKPYYSSGNGDVSSLNSWNTKRDGSGIPPRNFNELSASFIIQPGHIMQNELSACLPVIMIENNGVLNSNSGMKLNLVEVFAGGTFIQHKEISNTGYVKQLIVHNNGNYVHDNKGAVPGNIKKLEQKSTVIFTDCSITTFSDNIKWGNVVFDITKGDHINFSSGLRHISGNLEIRNTGENAVLYTDVTDTVSIGGELVLNKGTLEFCRQGNNIRLEIGRKLKVQGGVFTDRNSNSGKNTGQLTVSSNEGFHLMGGKVEFNCSNSLIIIDRPLITWIQQSQCDIRLPDVVIGENNTLEIKGSDMGPVAAGKTITVENNATVICNTAIIKGTGAFEIHPGGTISTSHPEGIYSQGNMGSVQTDTRIFSSEMNVIYSGNVSPQYSGVFDTGTPSPTIKNFTLKKSMITNVVVLNQDFRISGTFFHQRGNLNKNSFSLEKAESSNAAMLAP